MIVTKVSLFFVFFSMLYIDNTARSLSGRIHFRVQNLKS